jgi:hypothetical protein
MNFNSFEFCMAQLLFVSLAKSCALISQLVKRCKSMLSRSQTDMFICFDSAPSLHGHSFQFNLPSRCQFLCVCVCVFFACVFAFSLRHSPVPLDHRGDRQALVDFFLGTTSNNTRWRIKTYWLSANISFCDWYGVGCTISNASNANINQTQVVRVSFLRLRNNNLVGTFPESFGSLVMLTNIDLASNILSGPLPWSVGNLTRLQRLDLWRNRLAGPLPETMGNLSRIEYISIQSNALTGPLPISLGNAIQLATLDLARNQLSGEIPPSMAA